MFNNFFRKSCHLWDNVEKCCRAGQVTDDNITRCVHIACWLPKATNTHSEYVTLFAFPLQQWLYERSSMLRYTCIAGISDNQHCWMSHFQANKIFADKYGAYARLQASAAMYMRTVVFWVVMQRVVVITYRRFGQPISNNFWYVVPKRW